jgi:hypothetical protein
MNFINGIWCVEGVVFFSDIHPFPILPFILIIPGDGGSSGPQFPEMSIGVTLIHDPTFEALYMILINLPSPNVRNESLPDSTLVESDEQGVGIRTPMVEITGD